MLNAMAHDGHGSAVHRSSPQFFAPHRFLLLSHDSHARLLCPPLPCAICRALPLPLCLDMTLTMARHHGMAPWRPDVVDRVSKHIITVCTCTAWSKSAAFARLRSLPVRCRRAGRRMVADLVRLGAMSSRFCTSGPDPRQTFSESLRLFTAILHA
jgi:hypothetical protein